jgi:hypothetical protein
MSLTKTVGFFAGTTLAIGGAAFGADQTNDFAAEIAGLKAQIAEMKNAQGDAWLTEQRASEIRGIVTDVLADAETRSSLQGSGAGAGYDNGFFLSSADGNYSMKINVLQQIRWAYADVDTGEAWGFENKRTRMTFSGNIVDSSWSYKVGFYFGYSNSAEDFGEGELADVNVSKDFGNGFSMTVGQFKLPFGAEYGLDSGNTQFMDYSVISTAFGPGFGQGLMFSYSADMFRVMAAYVNGENEVNQPWGPGAPKSDFTGAARAEFKFAGNWAQFNDGMSFRGEEFGAMLGAGVLYASNESNGLGGSADVFKLTVDGTVDFGGGNIAAAFYWTDVDGFNNNPWGFTVGGGFFVSDEIELVARWESFDDDAGTDINTLTVGGNWYLAKNTAKFQADFGYAFDALTLPGGLIANNNWVPSTDDGEWVIRGQLSFSF